MRDQILRRHQTLVTASRPLKHLMETTLQSMGIDIGGPVMPTQETRRRKRGRCSVCPWKKDRKGASQCKKCKQFLCKEHSIAVCHTCFK
ncbi:PiggyBac transposable element-derived protein 4 [Elysia marginata]|uniref:PiggyBac transposable element-derived protein 4 n=1 Tax=Elysia marginata TaxID=1093978 RepID=A0AAV4F4B8_9GAST|nr:PiggyBac transposable element-derived protein 4 [Elysia marginata]